MAATGPGGIVPGSYNNGSLSRDQQQWLWQYFGHSGNAPDGYNGEHVSGDAGQNFQVGQTGPTALQTAEAAQQYQVQQNQPAIATLQGQEGSLSQAYQNLLTSTMAQGSATYNTTVSGENAYLGQRGLLSQQGLGNTQLSQAENIVNTSNAANQANILSGQQTGLSGIAGEIASLQAGNVPGALTFGGNLANTEAGITNINTQAQEQLAQAKLPQYVQAGGVVFNPATGLTSTGGGASYGGGSPTNPAITAALKMLAMNGSKNKPLSSINQFVT